MNDQQLLALLPLSASGSDLNWTSDEEEKEEGGEEEEVEGDEPSGGHSTTLDTTMLPQTKLSEQPPIDCERVVGRDSSRGSEIVMPSAVNGKHGASITKTANNRSLQLLDLPVDVLREIVKRVNRSMDLISLALTHSAMHDIVMPQMYSCFDIMWPDNGSTDDSSSDIDALTFGLATLVMAEEIFNGPLPDASAGRASPGLPSCQAFATARRPHTQQQEQQKASHPGSRGSRWRKGNHYAYYTRKFCIGNGPEHLVSKYFIAKESGKMLGTLVALAIARMPLLETFIWDMRTGVVRDVWMALCSLGERTTEGGCRLKHVWLRCHDNSLVPVIRRPLIAAPIQTTVSAGFSSSSSPIPVPPAAPGVVLLRTPPGLRAMIDRPNFSILPPLESLSVLDIDELAYLEEMSVLIEKSQPRLRELRLGIAFEARERDWVTSLAGDGLVQVDHSVTWQSSAVAGSKTLAGPLGVLVGRIYDLNDRRRSLGLAPANSPTDFNVKPSSVPGGLPGPGPGIAIMVPSSKEVPGISELQPATHAATEGSNAPDQVGAPSPPLSSAEELINVGVGNQHEKIELAKTDEGCIPAQAVDDASTKTQKGIADTGSQRAGRLGLELLELERVPLCVPLMLDVFDWRVMTSLTILNCPHHERLWRSLRRACRPVSSVSTRTSSSVKSNSESTHSRHRLNYPLKLKKLWTNTVSPALITFLRDTLAPDSLEVLFLQEAYDYKSQVTIDSICRGAIRRHRRSLKKLLIDSVERSRTGQVVGGRAWRKWMLSEELVTFVINSKLSSLRELSIALDGKDWHVFLQRLPSIPHLRSLYVTSLTSPFRTRFGLSESREMALQTVDVIALRPEMELCYLAIGQKCFEILEGSADKKAYTRADPGPGTDPSSPDSVSTLSSDEDGDVQSVEENDEGDGAGVANPVDISEAGSDGSSSTQPASEGPAESWVSQGDSPIPLRLREILFFDEKVAIFKARSGRL